MVPWVKPLTGAPEDLSSIPQHPHKANTEACICNPTVPTERWGMENKRMPRSSQASQSDTCIRKQLRDPVSKNTEGKDPQPRLFYDLHMCIVAYSYHIPTQKHIHKKRQTLTHTHKLTRIQIHTYTHKLTRIQTHIHTHKHTYKNTYKHTYTQAHTYTNTHREKNNW